MNQQKIKILVASHKPDYIYKDDVYTPIHVGRSVSKFTSEMKHMIGDNTGCNISNKNPYYCELTAQYWGWKNLHTEYIGLCHYRRYFHKLITSDNIDKIITDANTVILAAPIKEAFNIGIRLNITNCMEDVQIFIDCIKKVAPTYYDSAIKFLSNNTCYPYNMFVMKKETFNQFAEWQFSILEEMEKHIRLSGYNRRKRIYGYMGEILLGIYCIHHKMKKKLYPIIQMPGCYKKSENVKRIFGNFYRSILHKLRFNNSIILDPQAVRIGLNNDNIII